LWLPTINKIKGAFVAVHEFCTTRTFRNWLSDRNRWISDLPKDQEVGGENLREIGFRIQLIYSTRMND
jgi:hypothetical protein